MKPVAREVADTANEIIGLFSSATREVPKFADASVISSDVFSRLWECDFHFLDTLGDRTEGYERKVLVSDDQREQAELVWPVDIAAIGYHEDDHVYGTGRIATASPSEVRGKVTIVPSRMVTSTYGEMSEVPGGEWWARTHIGGLVGQRWKCITAPRVGGRTTAGGERLIYTELPKADQFNDMIMVTLGMALTARYSWHVAFGSHEGGPRLLLPTNPAGGIALFRDREKNADQGRRAALRHWVSNHYRDPTPAQTVDLIYVCDHLRGSTTFSWRGLACELLVSQFDLEKNEFFKQQADLWRAQRKHNRVRLRRKA